ncbi:HTH domain-containing protein [Variovorax rhizosphaerae]|uniref:HTH domain-containing protein n=1 Tax=Variovorax rhizosphaerae TaxID=1836200 RepID=A0ABU8WX67_9BURK
MAMSWREAIAKVLDEADGPLHYSQISEQVLSRDYYKTDGATPAATVNAQISSSIKHEGERSPFLRVGKGVFTLRSKPAKTVHLPTATALVEDIPAESEIDDADSIIRSFGMYWQRDLVVWKGDPKIYGQQQASAKSVDFGRQKGIYILYDHHTVVYGGRSIDRPLGKRLLEHTVDRLGGRWNRFSWFGLLDVTNEGNLREVPLRASLAALVATLEALLIEALEPPQNRKRGDDFSAIEYLQDIDPVLKEREIQNTLRAVEQRLRDGL